MRLNELHLSNYRNYDSLTLTFEKGLVIFLGENAQGKTNILESIYVLAMTKSHRTSSEQELIRWDTEGARISGSVSLNDPVRTVFVKKRTKNESKPH